MDAEQAGSLLDLLMSGELPEAEGAEILVALAERGETAVEVAAFVRGLQQRAVRIPTSIESLDVCGTGGSGLTRYNVSTTVAFICAAAGIPVAKHGNRGSRRPNGSFDVLEELDIPFGLPPERLAAVHEQTNIALLFARVVHPAVAAVVPYRKAAGRRTIFNLAGPLANPMPIRRQIIGTVDVTTAALVAATLNELTGDADHRAWVVRGEPGIDELSVVGPSRVWVVDGAQVREHELTDPPHATRQHSDIPGGDAPENAALFREILSGGGAGPLWDMVVLNAGAAIDCWHDREPGSGIGAKQAAELLSDGAVVAAVERYRQAARS